MKAKIKRGNGFRGLLNYVFGPGEHQKKDRAALIGGNMSGTNPRSLSAEFRISRQLRQNAKNPAWHCSLSMPAGEKQIFDEKWQKIVSAFLKKMKISNDHQYCVVRHNDTEHDHVHIIMSRVNLNGKLWGGANDVKKAIIATQQLENEFHLTLTAGFDKKKDVDVKKPTSAEIQKSARNNQAPVRAVLQEIISKALADKPITAVFLERLQVADVKVKPNIAKNGRVAGLAFHYKSVSFKGSSLGKKFGWKGLQENGLQYNVKRDARLLQEYQKNADFSIGKISCPDVNKYVYKSTLILAFRYDTNGRYFWKNRDFVAFEDVGDSIIFNTINKTAIKAGIQLAKSKNWSTLKITSENRDFLIASYIEARKHFDAGRIRIDSDLNLSNEIEEIEKNITAEEAKNGKNASSGTAVEKRGGQHEFENRDADVMSAENRHIRKTSDRSSNIHRRSCRRHSREYNENQKDLQIINSESDFDSNADSVANRNGSWSNNVALSESSLHQIESNTNLQTGNCGSSDKGIVMNHLEAKKATWEQQAAALDAPAYRITIADAAGVSKPWNLGRGKGPTGAEEFYSDADVKKKILMLSAKNAQSSNIYITPIDENYHYIVLDDTDTDRLNQLTDAGFHAALVQESSPGNLQAVFKCKKIESPTEQEAANAVVQRINKKFGDPKFSGVIHPFRLAGFTNRKQKYKKNGKFPFVKITEAPGGICKKMELVLVDARKQHKLQQQHQKKMQRVQKTKTNGGAVINVSTDLTEIQKEFIETRNKIKQFALKKARKNEEWRVDDSVIDFRTAKKMLKRYSEADVENAIIMFSENISERHSNVSNYAKKTVAAAAAAVHSDFSKIIDAPPASPAERKKILDEMAKYFPNNRKLVFDGEELRGTRDSDDQSQENEGGMRM